eukprot:1562081-Prymnesium_polylepis.1
MQAIAATIGHDDESGTRRLANALRRFASPAATGDAERAAERSIHPRSHARMSSSGSSSSMRNPFRCICQGACGKPGLCRCSA